MRGRQSHAPCVVTMWAGCLKGASRLDGEKDHPGRVEADRFSRNHPFYQLYPNRFFALLMDQIEMDLLLDSPIQDEG